MRGVDAEKGKKRKRVWEKKKTRTSGRPKGADRKKNIGQSLKNELQEQKTLGIKRRNSGAS